MSIRLLLSAGLVSSCVFLSCAGENDLLSNGAFENVSPDGMATGWKGHGGTSYRYESGAGRNMTRALVFDVKAGDAYGYPCQQLALQTGSRYHIEGWIRTEGLTGTGGARIGIDGINEKGKVVCQYAPGVCGTSESWTKIDMDVDWPKGTKSFRFVAFVERGCTGKAYFDDLRVTPAEKPLFGLLVSSAYRNRAKDGTVRFIVPVKNVEEVARRDIQTRFHIPNGAGGWMIRQADIKNGAVQMSVKVESMPLGRHPVQFCADAKDGSRIAFQEVFFEHVTVFSYFVLRIDAQGRTLVDGKLFFPVGIYAHNMTESDASCLEKSPFNAVMSYMDANEKLLDLCHRHGLKIIGNLKHVFAGGAVDQPDVIKTEADESAYVADKVSRLRNHPALLAWYVNDEMGVNWIDRLVKRRNLLEFLDPDHPVWTVQYQIDQYGEYLGTYDVAGTDPYPIAGPNPEKDIGMPGRWTRKTKEASFGARPIWMVPQFFDPEVYYPKATYKMRAPTEAELRNMCWQCIAEGANGIVIYAYMALHLMDETIRRTGRTDKEPFAKKWAEACRVGQEIRDRSELLLSDDMTELVQTKDSTNDIFVRAWRMSGAAYVLVVNGSYKSGRCTLEFNDKTVSVGLEPLAHVIRMLQ